MVIIAAVTDGLTGLWLYVQTTAVTHEAFAITKDVATFAAACKGGHHVLVRLIARKTVAGVDKLEKELEKLE